MAIASDPTRFQPCIGRAERSNVRTPVRVPACACASLQTKTMRSSPWTPTGMESVKGLPGHASITTAVDTYGHLTVEDARAALEAAAGSPGGGAAVTAPAGRRLSSSRRARRAGARCAT